MWKDPGIAVMPLYLHTRRAWFGVKAICFPSRVVSFLLDGSPSSLLSLSFFYEESCTLISYRLQQSLFHDIDQRLITYHLNHAFVVLPLHDGLNLFMATNGWKYDCSPSDSGFLLAHSQYRLRMSSFPCIRNGRQQSGFIIAGSSQSLWFHEVDCDNQEWFHVRVTESDVVEEERLPPPRRSGDESDDAYRASLRRFVLDLPHCLASHGLRGIIVFLDYRVIQSYMCSSLCPFPHIQIASCLLTREDKGAATVLNGVWVVLEFSLHCVPARQALKPEDAVVYILEERREKRWVKRNAGDVELAKKWVTESLDRRYHAIQRRYNGSTLGKPAVYYTRSKEAIRNPATGDVLLCNL